MISIKSSFRASVIICSVITGVFSMRFAVVGCKFVSGIKPFDSTKIACCLSYFSLKFVNSGCKLSQYCFILFIQTILGFSPALV